MKHSLTTKITIFFVIALMLVCVLFITFGRIQMNKALSRMQANQINAINYLLELYDRSIPPQDIQQYFKNFGLELVKDKYKDIEEAQSQAEANPQPERPAVTLTDANRPNMTATEEVDISQFS